MLTGRHEAIPESGELNQPTPSQSAVASFQEHFSRPFVFLPIDEEKRKVLKERADALELESDKGEQGLAQKTGNFVAGLAGSILNPLNLAGGEVFGLAANPLIKAGGGLLGKYLPSETSALLTRPLGEGFEKLPEFVGKESAATLTGKAVSGFSVATGFSLPEELARTYNHKSNDFQWFNGIKAATADGGFALTLMSAPYLAGTIWGKIFKGVSDHSKMPLPGEKAPEISISGKEPEKPSEETFHSGKIDEAVKDRRITPEQGEWMKDYISNSKHPEELSHKATEMLIKDGHPVNASTKSVLFKILSSDDVDNFNTALGDGLASNLSDEIKPLYNNFIGRNAVDQLKENPSMLDGLRGIVSFVNKRLEKLPEEMINFNKIMRRLLPESLKEENPFTQAKIIRDIKKFRDSGFSIPKQVDDLLKQNNKIKTLKDQNKEYQKLFDKTNKTIYKKKISINDNKIKEFENNKKKILSHNEEIEHIKNTIMPEGKLVDNFKQKKEYQRLHDLTRVRKDARILLSEMNLRHEYDIHSSYATLLDTITKTMRAEFSKLANPEDINNYMRERIHNNAPELKQQQFEKLKKETKNNRENLDHEHDELKKDSVNKEGKDSRIKEMDESIKETEAKENKTEYEEVKRQMEEFNEKSNVFSTLIKCVLGTINV